MCFGRRDKRYGRRRRRRCRRGLRGGPRRRYRRRSRRRRKYRRRRRISRRSRGRRRWPRRWSRCRRWRRVRRWPGTGQRRRSCRGIERRLRRWPRARQRRRPKSRLWRRLRRWPGTGQRSRSSGGPGCGRWRRIGPAVFRQANVAGLALLARPLVFKVVSTARSLARLRDAAEDLVFGRAHVRGLVPVLPQRDIVGAEVTRVAIAGRVLPRAAVGVAAREADPQMAVFRRRGIRHALEVVRVLVAAQGDPHAAHGELVRRCRAGHCTGAQRRFHRGRGRRHRRR
jgi:hypothetical protein